MSRHKHYRTERWDGKALYACETCHYNTLVRADMEEHVRTEHGAHADEGAATTAAGAAAASTTTSTKKEG